MKIRRFVAKDMRTALAEISKELGPDAAIVSSRRVSGGVELLAAIDYDPEVLASGRQSSVVDIAKPAHPAVVTSNISDEERHPSNNDESVDDFLARAAMRGGRASALVAEKIAVDENRATLEAQKAALLAELGRERSRLASEEVSPKLQIEFGQDPGLLSLREEIRQLRGLFEEQMQGLAWKEMENRHPMHAWLAKRLSLLDLSPRLRDQYAKTDCKAPEKALAHALAAIAGDVVITKDDLLANGGMYALVGATGVGKTTTAAKLAARFAMAHGAQSVALVSTDNFRISAHDQLRVYARLIGCAFRVVEHEGELASVLDQLVDKRLIIIDSAGMSQRDQRLTNALRQLRSDVYPLKHLLVMSATAQRMQVQDCIKQFGVHTLSGAILTKLDEATSLGAALSSLIESRLPFYFACDGQRVPEDLRQWRGPQLVERARKLAEQYQEAVDAWLLAQELKVQAHASA